ALLVAGDAKRKLGDEAGAIASYREALAIGGDTHAQISAHVALAEAGVRVASDAEVEALCASQDDRDRWTIARGRLALHLASHASKSTGGHGALAGTTGAGARTGVAAGSNAGTSAGVAAGSNAGTSDGAAKSTDQSAARAGDSFARISRTSGALPALGATGLSHATPSSGVGSLKAPALGATGLSHATPSSGV